MSRRSTKEVHHAVKATLQAVTGIPRSAIVKATGLADSVVDRALKQLRAAGTAAPQGSGRGTKWFLAGTLPASAKNAAVTSPSLTPSGHYAPAAELRWSIGCDGIVTFRAGPHSIEVAGETLDRVNRARQAIAEA